MSQVVFMVNGELVDPNGNPVGEPSGPFASLAEPVQKSLKDAGITNPAEAKALGLEGLMKLPEIGKVTATDILAL